MRTEFARATYRASGRFRAQYKYLRLRRQISPQVDIEGSAPSLSVQHAGPEPVCEQPGVEQRKDKIDARERNRPAD